MNYHSPIKSKPHYQILDGLRGVAAILVLIFHIFEAHAPNKTEQIINHGYLAVDFFFMLSGFVIAYAYDDRWGKIRFKDFIKRRFVRLHPMVVFGTVVGIATFAFQQSGVFPNYDLSNIWKIALVTVVGFTLLPLPPSMDIRGWGEMHPLNGPAWSLFFEYIANILYALFIRKFPTKVLILCVAVAGGFLVEMALSKGDMIGGWAFTVDGLKVGFTRLMFPFMCGLLLSRIGKLIRIKNAFLFCSLAIVALLALPRFGGSEAFWINGLYEAFCIICIFPLIVLTGAGGSIENKTVSKVSKFLGDISYPLYITHYPLVYMYFAYVVNNKYSIQDAYPVAIITIVGAILLSYFYLKIYDEPVRKWLKKKLSL